MNKAWALPPFDRYIASLTGALTSIEAEHAGGPSTPDRAISHAVSIIRYAVQDSGGAVWLVGNGGSGTVADHIACDMALKGWRAFALTNPALSSKCANDFGYPHAFDMQLNTLARPGDVVIGMSCSGEGESVLGAMSNTRHVHITLSGFRSDNRLRKLKADASFYVPSPRYGEVQIAHLAILHAIIDLAEGVP